MWSVIRSVINACKPSKLNESFTYNNTVITDKNVSKKFDDYFVSVGKTFAEQITKSGPSFRSYLPEANIIDISHTHWPTRNSKYYAKYKK